MFLMIFGEKMFGDIVPGGIVRQAYCDKCKETTVFIEYEGQKCEYIYFIPIKKNGPRCHYLLCSECKTAYFDLNYHEFQKEKKQTIEERQAEFTKGWTSKEIEDFRKVLDEIDTISIKCPKCKHEFKVKDFSFEIKAQCPGCLNSFNIKKQTLIKKTNVSSEHL